MEITKRSLELRCRLFWQVRPYTVLPGLVWSWLNGSVCVGITANELMSQKQRKDNWLLLFGVYFSTKSQCLTTENMKCNIKWLVLDWFPIWIRVKNPDWSNLTRLNETVFLSSSEGYYLYCKTPLRLTTWSNKAFLCSSILPILAHFFCLSLLGRVSLASGSSSKRLPCWLHSCLRASRTITRLTAVLKVGLGTGGMRSQPSCSTSTVGWADRREQTEPMSGWCDFWLKHWLADYSNWLKPK